MYAIVPFLQALVQKRGSDLHLSSQAKPLLRVHGEMLPLSPNVLEKEKVEAMVNEILSPQQKKNLQDEKSIDISLKVKGLGIFRINIFLQLNGIGIAVRALSEAPPTIEQLQLPEIIKRGCHFNNGLVLVTGPTGSGKSTTLAAMINYINQNTHGHIITLEDPIEFFHPSLNCLVNQRQLGPHFTSFSTALRASLREDPDVILVGEMRDPETISMAITAAETGHLVFATLHTNSAGKSVDRILDSFSSEKQAQIRSMLSESLRMVISQRLIPRKDKQGRIAFFDVLLVSSAVANLIRENKTYQIPSVMQMGRSQGMILMDQSIKEAVSRGLISSEYLQETSDTSQSGGTYYGDVSRIGTQPLIQKKKVS